MLKKMALFMLCGTLFYSVSSLADAEMLRDIRKEHRYHQISAGYDIQPKYNVVRSCNGYTTARCRHDYYPQVSRQYFIVTDPAYEDEGLLRDHH